MKALSDCMWLYFNKWITNKGLTIDMEALSDCMWLYFNKWITNKGLRVYFYYRLYAGFIWSDIPTKQSAPINCNKTNHNLFINSRMTYTISYTVHFNTRMNCDNRNNHWKCYTAYGQNNFNQEWHWSFKSKTII
jgi:hypothetical protein